MSMTVTLLAATTLLATATPDGLTAEYFENNGFSQHEVSRIDPTIVTSVVPPPEINMANGYSVRWSGYFTPPIGGPKLFTSEVTNNAAVEIKVDGIVVSRKSGPIDQTPPKVVTLDAGQAYPIQVTVRSASPTTHRVAWRQLANPVWRELQTDELTAAVDPIEPDNTVAVGTGTNRVATFWRGVPGINQYAVYRRQLPAEFNFDLRLNGSLGFTPTYQGGDRYLFSDTTASQSMPYAYVVKTVYANPVTSLPCESSPSSEDSDESGLNRVPWDASNPGFILLAVRDAYANDDIDLSGHLRVACPDGRIAEDGQSEFLRPDVVPIDGTNQGLDADGGLVTLSSTAEENYGDSEQLKNERSGPYRKIISLNGYRGVSGKFVLPPIGQTILARYGYQRYKFDKKNRPVGNDTPIEPGNRSPDAICLMLGVELPSETSKAESGAYFYSRGTGEDQWIHFALAYPKAADRPVPPLPIANLNQSRVYEPGAVVVIKHYAVPDQATKRNKSVPSIGTMEDISDPSSLSLLANYVGIQPNDRLRVKRLCSIAQPRASRIVYDEGYLMSSSRVLGAQWREGAVMSMNSTVFTGWTSGNKTKNGSFPLNRQIVDWSETSRYVTETGIKVDLRP
jgi:hypothetical protein